MTNREWLQSLNDRDFLQIIGEIFFGKLVDGLEEIGDTIPELVSFVRKDVLEWLQAEKK